MATIQTSKWEGLAQRVAQLKEGESIVLECEGDPTVEAKRVRAGLKNKRVCILIRRTVRIVGGKIVITRVGPTRGFLGSARRLS